MVSDKKRINEQLLQERVKHREMQEKHRADMDRLLQEHEEKTDVLLRELQQLREQVASLPVTSAHPPTPKTDTSSNEVVVKPMYVTSMGMRWAWTRKMSQKDIQARVSTESRDKLVEEFAALAYYCGLMQARLDVVHTDLAYMNHAVNLQRDTIIKLFLRMGITPAF